MKRVPNMVRSWEESGQAKITLKVNSEQEMYAAGSSVSILLYSRLAAVLTFTSAPRMKA